MARILRSPAGIDDAAARQALAGAGVQVLQALDPQGSVEASVLELVLQPDARFVREEMTAEPPPLGQEDLDMGAWHVNSVDEVHSVLDGRGIMEFVTQVGEISLLVEGGDVLVIQQAEHRYRPVEPQRWAVRWAGGPDTMLEATQTGRPSQPWPSVPSVPS